MGGKAGNLLMLLFAQSRRGGRLLRRCAASAARVVSCLCYRIVSRKEERVFLSLAEPLSFSMYPYVLTRKKACPRPPPSSSPISTIGPRARRTSHYEWRIAQCGAFVDVFSGEFGLVVRRKKTPCNFFWVVAVVARVAMGAKLRARAPVSVKLPD